MTPVATIKERMSRTRRHLRALRRTERALEKLQAHRRHLLDELQPAQRPTVMYDSITLDAIPSDAPAVAGYVGGRWPTFRELRGRWPKARLLSIAVTASEDADCLDVEAGDARPDQAAAWVKRQHARGLALPVVYTSASQITPLLRALAAGGVSRSQVRLWSAHYTFHPHLCGPQCGFGITTTTDATQYSDKALGRNLDESLCSSGFWS